MIARVLIVAGSDSGGGAGIQADIRTVTMLGGHPMTAVTAITAQNTCGVQAVHPVPPEMVVAQMRSVLDDLGADAVKIGMIGSADTVHAVADVLEPLRVPVVFDPVMIATSGSVLADAETIAAFGRLMRLSALVTPNTPELAALAGQAVEDERTQAEAARVLRERSGAGVLAKGGHLSGRDVTDILYARDGAEHRWTNPRIDTRHSHGTGCTLASGIATGLAAGLTLPEATGRAIAYVRAALAAAPGIGGGHGPMGHALCGVPFEAMTRCPA